MPRNDGRTQAPNVFGKPGTTYPEGSLNTPAIVEERTDNVECAPKAFLDPHDLTATALLTEQVKAKGDNTAAVIREVFETLPGENITEAIKEDEMGNYITVQRQKVQFPLLTPLVSNAGLVQEYRGINFITGHKVSRTYPDGIDPAFAVVTEINNADGNVPGSRATIYTYLVIATDPIPDDDATTVYERRKYSDNTALQIEIKTVYEIPESFEETEDQGHSFPEIFRSFLSQDDWGSYYIFRPGFSEVIPCRVEHTFGTSRVVIDPTIVREAAWRMPLGFSGHGLTNEEICTFYKNGIFLILSLPASIPDAATYDGWVADPDFELILGGNSRIWRAGIYQTTTIYCRPR